MREMSGNTSHDTRDEDDEDDYEESGGGSRLLGFMFGNVDDSGDLDADYLDEDAKEHLSTLADKLGPSLMDIDLSIKLLQTPADGSEQDYDEKAEDAVDYEDIEEEYEGPEIQATTEEDHLLPKKDYFSAEVSIATLEHKATVFDDENYDEYEDIEKEEVVVDENSEAQIVSQDEQNEHIELICDEEKSPENNMASIEHFEVGTLAVDFEDFQEDGPDNMQNSLNAKTVTSLPILCIEDGMVVLRFSEIFGFHEPLKKEERRDHRYWVPKERYKAMDTSDIVEEDEEAFLKGSSPVLVAMKHGSLTQDDNALAMDGDIESAIFGSWQGVDIRATQVDVQRKDLCLSAEPMKEDRSLDLYAGQKSPSYPKFYPLDQQDWEDGIIWDNSPTKSYDSSESCIMSGPGSETFYTAEIELEARPQNVVLQQQIEPDEKEHNLFLHNFPVSVEPFGSTEFSEQTNHPFTDKKNHPQLLRLESRVKVDSSNYSGVRKESNNGEFRQLDIIKRLGRLTLQNREMLEGSWLDNIIWEPKESISKPKLILDLQDELMLFEILDNKEGRHLCFHAGAMIVTWSVKSSGGDSFDLPGQGGPSAGQFNISNDKYYSNRKTPQQLKSHSKKRAAHGIKVMHSIPALKLQTMKPKLSNKDIANFHRPKALWYPHDNEVAAKEQGPLATKGPMKIILKTLGGKGSKLHVDAEETVSSVKAKASKKLDFKPSEKVKIFYSGKELEDAKSLAMENVRPNSVLHLVRTKIHLWPRAQKIPGESKSLRPPGAFKKKSDLSVKDGHVSLMEYCEERPSLLGNVGMGARLCTYYKKSVSGDQTASSLHSGDNSLGNVLTLDPTDRSPFLGDITPGCSQSSLETNLYRAPLFPHKLASTDYLLVRSAKGKLSLRRIDRIDVVGQQEPHMEVISPGSKGLQTYIGNRLLVCIYREFRANENRGLLPCIRADELSAQFPNLSEPFLRKRLKHCADLQRKSNGQLLWVMKRNFRIPLEEEIRRMVTPESVCTYESMLAGLHRLKRLGISRLTHPTGLSSAMNQLPDEAIALAAASHIERELQITPWNLTSNFVACTSQDRENIERLEITGVGDPSGRGLGFSYVRVTPKAPVSSAIVKKKVTAARGGSTATGTDSDLRRLSMEAACEVLLKFNVPEEQIAKKTRWHRIAMIRKLSSEQAASGVKVDPTTISKYARGQRMSFLQLQQQTREKCQEIWDRQIQSLSAADGDENESDSEANSDLDSFASDLENLLDAEECEEGEESNYEPKHDKEDGVRGLKMRRRPSQAQAEEEIEDEAAEATELCRMLMDDDEAERRKKKKTKATWQEGGLGSQLGFTSENANQTKKSCGAKQIIRTVQSDGSFISKENITRGPMEVEKMKSKKGNGKNGVLKRKAKVAGDGIKVIKEKKHTAKPVRESFVCGACGQSGHMRTNKNCPKYGEDLEIQVDNTSLEKVSGKSTILDPSSQTQQKASVKKLKQKTVSKVATVATLENADKLILKAKFPSPNLKCGPVDKSSEKALPGIMQSSEKPITSDAETGTKLITKISKIKISNKMKNEDIQVEPQKPSIVIHPPTEADRDQPRKKIIIKQTKTVANVDQVKREASSGLGEERRKKKKMIELSSFEKHREKERKQLAEKASRRKAAEERRLWEEEEKRRYADRLREEKTRKLYEKKNRMQEERRLAEIRRHEEARQREMEEQERQKAKKKKKKKKTEMRNEYLEEHRSSRSDRRMLERDRAAKRWPVIELGRYAAEYAPQTKRRRGGEVGLANILESIVEALKGQIDVSYLFLKPVSKKEAPDYLDIIENPMDLSTIREKVRRMEYKKRDDFRHDVWQINYNAHKYNEGRNPGIPPLADQLLELCDYLLAEKDALLTEAEADIA
ncbi:PREDICTED: transcription initiation factor TFIID subunit 1-like isoform X2 [Nelumbo nucifera]|uniref:Transcription initiation factor TFIID subunit 1 n=1 Tax=Nelumbo nucifera TaxID=4432 RepID=A0A1U8Q2U0_NELNU|nr:PREDICTED: transcription initiation factor TFIID subunit 1-like isoform X2 [Nelumbo nucifera]